MSLFFAKVSQPTSSMTLKVLFSLAARSRLLIRQVLTLLFPVLKSDSLPEVLSCSSWAGGKMFSSTV